MNKDQLLGNIKVALACLHVRLAALTSNQKHRRLALQLQEAGKVQRTLGQARQIIKRSIRQQMSAWPH